MEGVNMELEMEDSDFTGVPNLEALTRLLEPVVDKSETRWIALLISDYTINRAPAGLHLAEKYGIKVSREIFNGILKEVQEEFPEADLSTWPDVFEHLLTD